MSIAAALNILVTAPRAELVKDLKAIGSSISQVRNTIKEAMAGSADSVDDLERKIGELGVAWKAGAISAGVYFREIQRLQNEMKLDKPRHAAFGVFQAEEEARRIKEIHAAQTAQEVADAERVATLRNAIQGRASLKAAFLAEEEARRIKGIRAAQTAQEVADAERVAALRNAIQSRHARAGFLGMAGSGYGNLKQALSATGLGNPYIATAVAVGILGREFLTLERNLASTKAWSGATANEMLLLRESALSLGHGAAFSASEVAEAQKYLASAGLNTNQILVAQAAALDLAVAGDMELANATDIATRVMGAFHMQAGQLNEVVDAMASAAAHAVGSVENYAEALKFVGPLAFQAGVSLQDTTAALMVLHNQGMVGEMAGTGLRNMFVRLAAPTEQSAAVLKQFGIEISRTADGGLDLLNIILQLHAALARLSGPDSLKVLSAIGKTRTANAIAALVSDPEMYRVAQVAQAGSAGAAHAQAETKLDTTWGDLKRLWNSLKAAGTDLLELLSPLFDILISSAKFIVDLFDTLVTGLHASVVMLAELAVYLAGFIPGLGEWSRKTGKYLANVSDALAARTAAVAQIQGAAAQPGSNLADSKEFYTEAELAAREAADKAQEDALSLNKLLQEQVKYFGETKEAAQLRHWQEEGAEKAVIAQNRALQEQITQMQKLADLEKERQAILVGVPKALQEQLNEVMLQNTIWKLWGREADDLDRLIDQDTWAGDPSQAANSEMARDIRHRRELLDAGRDQAKSTKSMQEEAQKIIESVDPKEAFRTQYAHLEALRRAGKFAGHENAFELKRQELRQQFLKSSSNQFNPSAAEKGSQEAFKILHGGSGMLQVAKKQLDVLEKDAATSVRIETELHILGRDPRGELFGFKGE